MIDSRVESTCQKILLTMFVGGGVGDNVGGAVVGDSVGY